jgi:DNA-binding transcriptional MerR regulator
VASRIPGGALTSGQVGAATGVSADTVRHYEKLGLLARPLRTEAGYRLYPAQSVMRVATIRSALRAGFSLRELAGIFKERDAGGIPCRRVAAMASEKVARLNEQIAELTQLRDWLSDTLQLWKKRLDRTPNGKPAGLLEALTNQLRRTGKSDPKGNTDENAGSNFSGNSGIRRPRTTRKGSSDARSASKPA